MPPNGDRRKLDGAVVAVVGAAGGLGSAITRTLHARGAKPILAGPHPERLEALGIDEATVVELDLRDPAAGDALIEATDRLDGLVHAAGGVVFGPLEEIDDVIIEELFLVNVRTKAALSAAVRTLALEVRRSGVQVCDVRPPHTETGLATRPLAGTAPRLPHGLDPQVVADRIVAAIEAVEREVAPMSSAGRAEDWGI